MRFEFNDSLLKERRQYLRKRQTLTERILWQQLKGEKLEGCRFFRQFSVGPYIIDFYCPKKRLAIELDGNQHLQYQEYDQERTLYFNSKNIRVLRFWNHQILQGMELVLQKISEEIVLCKDITE